MAWDNRVLWITAGSNLYGTNTPESDEDYLAIFMPTEEYVVGLKRVDEVDLSIKSKKDDGRNDSDAVDDKFYEFRQFMNLAIQNNPNILEILFVNEANIKYIDYVGEEILKHRDLFPHRGLIKRFLGYAYSQKHKMVIKSENYQELKRAHDFLENNIDHSNEKQLIVEYKDAGLSWLHEKKSHFTIGDLNIQRHLQMQKVKRMINERFSKVTNRSGIIEKYGYDTRAGCHLVRLMVEGQELLETGSLTFPLKEKQLVLDVKLGKYKMKEVLEMAEDHEKQIESLKDTTVLRAKPQYKKVQELTMKLLKDNFGWHGY